MSNFTSSLVRFAPPAGALLSVALLCACPPDWNTLEPPSEDAGGGVDDGGVNDGGVNDGGVVDDGGVNDGGVVEDGGQGDDGGPSDGGVLEDGGRPLNDAGVDGGAPTDGGFDGGVVVDAGPCVPFEPTGLPLGWTCLGSGTYPSCGPLEVGEPIVDIVPGCPTTKILTDRGLVRELEPSGALNVLFDFKDPGCGGAPLQTFRTLHVEGETLVGVGIGGYCVRYENAGVFACQCRSAPEAPTEIQASALVDDKTLLLSVGSNKTHEINFDSGATEEVEATSFRATDIVTVKRADGYRAQTFREVPTEHSCLTRNEAGAETTPADGCAAFVVPPTLEIPTVLHLSKEPQLGARRPFHLIPAEAPAGGTLRVFGGHLHQNVGSELQERAIRYPLLTLPATFSAAGLIDALGFRAALGLRGGGVLLATGQGDFEALGSSADATELGTIRVMTRGRDRNRVPTGHIWAVADGGLMLRVEDATNFFRFAFETPPVAAEVVVLRDVPVLVVGEATGQLQLFNLSTESPDHLQTVTNIALADTGAVPNFPEAIAAVTTPEDESRLLIITTAGQAWVGVFTNLSTGGVFSLLSSPDLRQELSPAFPSENFLLSSRAKALEAVGEGTTLIYTTGRVGNDWNVNRYRITATDQAGFEFSVSGSDVVPVPSNEPELPFRFSTSVDPNDNNQEGLTWTTLSGQTASQLVNLGTIQGSPSATTVPTDFTSGPNGGGIVTRFSSECGLVFSATQPSYYLYDFASSASAVLQSLPTPFVVRAAIPLSAGQTLIGGASGHLFILDHVSCDEVPAIASMTPVAADRPSADITAIGFVTPNHLLVGAADGSARIFSSE